MFCIQAGPKPNESFFVWEQKYSERVRSPISPLRPEPFTLTHRIWNVRTSHKAIQTSVTPSRGTTPSLESKVSLTNTFPPSGHQQLVPSDLLWAPHSSLQAPDIPAQIESNPWKLCSKADKNSPLKPHVCLDAALEFRAPFFPFPSVIATSNLLSRIFPFPTGRL